MITCIFNCPKWLMGYRKIRTNLTLREQSIYINNHLCLTKIHLQAQAQHLNQSKPLHHLQTFHHPKTCPWKKGHINKTRTKSFQADHFRPKSCFLPQILLLQLIYYQNKQLFSCSLCDKSFKTQRRYEH